MSRQIHQAAPTLKRHKGTGHAYARFCGRQLWFGRFDDARTHIEFAAFKASWEANGRVLPEAGDSPALSVGDLVALYQRHAEVYFRRVDGTSTHELVNIQYTVRPLLTLYGELPGACFSLGCLKSVREEMIGSGLARKTVNDRIWRVLRIFAWACEEELIPPEIYAALRVLRPLKRGRTMARESEPVRPVTEEDFQAALSFMSSPVRDMALLQWHTGMRPGEAVQLRLAEVEEAGLGWQYRPRQHKTMHQGRERIIPLGPRSMAVIQPYLERIPTPDPELPLFSPGEAMRERHDRMRRRAKGAKAATGKRSARDRDRVSSSSGRVGDGYTTASYRRAIARSCAAAGIEAWSPNRLRHSAATRLRRELGIDAARVVLGHGSAAITEVYAELDTEQAFRAMQALG